MESILNDMMLKLDNLEKEVKNIHKFVKKIERDSQDPTGSKKAERKKNSVYHRECKISREFAEFAGLPPDHVTTRKEGLAIANAYVKNNNLSTGTNIAADDRLAALLSPSKNGNKLTFLTMNSRLKHHFLME